MREKKNGKKPSPRFRSPSGVCRTTALTHGVRGGGPDTSGRKRQRGNTDRRMQSDGGLTNPAPTAGFNPDETLLMLHPPRGGAREGCPGGKTKAIAKI